MRKKIVAGNWKMNMDYTSGVSLFSEVINMVNDEVRGEQEVVVCPPFVHLHSLAQLANQNVKISIGAQNCHQAESGAYTGEVSSSMIQSVGAKYVILGHSERRQYFGETNELLAKKTDAVIKTGLLPIFCIGETLEERNNNIHFDVIKRQLTEGVFHLGAEDFAKVVLAYEPVWAIGTGVTASKEQAQEVHAYIRKQIEARYGDAVAENTTILYGGSCNPKNAPELFSQPDIDGGLIGGASLKSRDFTDIVKVFNK
ncbi:triosephosphate isomerase [Arcticibacter tournemirensis]|uniref:Triosephosphate isomerase n=1 Tax=Arcticibacter tournemirensis TaxID=699437 RepID=A0A4Q0M3K3_9SPHI|nr:triose-phosphate isomerase [Arcticibacter tournemirensis]KAA8481816.1 triose-phosphate isomerase [Arcticibacter tournemirensis]RXF67373.1 triose-phosphate isomerase [Arcticibacter tournemirensis]TQM50148.1 triosephosphate isomerase [Arcticibacter tournemirensis]